MEYGHLQTLDFTSGFLFHGSHIFCAYTLSSFKMCFPELTYTSMQLDMLVFSQGAVVEEQKELQKQSKREET